MFCRDFFGSHKTLSDAITACNLDSECPGVFDNCGVDYKICRSPIDELTHSCGPILYVKGMSRPYVYMTCINVKNIFRDCFGRFFMR